MQITDSLDDLVDVGTSFCVLGPDLEHFGAPALRHLVVTCRYCGSQYMDPAVLRCADGCGAPLVVEAEADSEQHWFSG